MTQITKILEILNDNQWHCVNEFIDTYCVDYRRRLVDIKKKGYQLENRKCQSHNYHSGFSKEWRLVESPASKTIILNWPNKKENPQAKLFKLGPSFNNI